MATNNTTNGTVDAQDDVWNEATASDYVKFGEESVDVQFVNGKVNVVPGMGGKKGYEFDVIQTTEAEGKQAKILGTQSKGLLNLLKEYRPLEDKRFEISRKGEGFSIEYTVEEI